ncbi:MAG: MCE family protein [Burkholderiales bacterium]|nr:MCE family protein [Burkholderiales bacterium]
MNTTPQPSSGVTHLEIKAKLLMVLTLILLCGSALFVMYSRGFFEATQRLVLMAEDSEGVVVGMDLTFSGFPIGRVHRIELAEDGKVRILLDVTAKDAHWLRTSSVFTLVRGVVGSPNIRAYTGVLDDPVLPDGAVRTVLQGDLSAEIPKVIAGAKELIDNLNTLTNASGPLSTSLGNLQTLTGRLNQPAGALQVLLGNEQDARKVIATIERSNALLTKLGAIATQAETQVFGPQGVMPQTLATIRQLDSLLGESRDSLKKVDAILRDAQVISANAKGASADLAALRADVDTNLRKIESLVNEINRKWPFARNTEIQLP